MAVRSEEIISVTRAMSDPDNTDAEFTVLVRCDLKGLEMGRQLLEKMISYAHTHGLPRLMGITMPNNRGMITLAQRLGFNIDVQLKDGIVNLILPLQADGRQWAGCNALRIQQLTPKHTHNRSN